MTQRLRVVAMQRLLAMAAGRWFAIVDGVGVSDEGALNLGVSMAAAGLSVREFPGTSACSG
jgi:hypothetical protein